MQMYFHSRLCSYLPRVPILVEGTVSNSATTCQLAVMRVLVVCLLNILYANTLF